MELELGFAKMPHCQGLAVGVALDLVSRLFPNPHWFDDNTPHTAPLTHASDFGVVEPVVYSEFYTPPTPHTHTHIHMETQLFATQTTTHMRIKFIGRVGAATLIYPSQHLFCYYPHFALILISPYPIFVLFIHTYLPDPSPVHPFIVLPNHCV